MTQAVQTAHRAADSDAMTWGARFGLASRGAVYVLLSAVAFEVAWSGSRKEADQRGALSSLAGNTGGKLLVGLLAAGFAAYALWRFSEALVGPAGEEKKAGPRLKSLARGVAYASLTYTAVKILAGSGSGSQAAQQKTFSARLMAHTGGRLAVGTVGAVVVVIGAVMLYQGVKRTFARQLDLSRASAATRTTVLRLGTVGTAARGIVFALTGALVIDAAVTQSPRKAAGLDGALRTLAAQPYGKFLLSAAAVGLLAFGLYGFTESRWHRT